MPVRWWVLLALFLFSLWLAAVVATPPAVAWTGTAVAVAAGGGVLLGYGHVPVEVGDRALRAGRAHLDWQHCGPATALDSAAARRTLGVDADPRAFLVVRPYVRTAVRVDVDDPEDPTPYWVVSTRHPRRLADSINAARVLAD